MLMLEGEEERKNFALFPTENTEVDVSKLKQRLQNYKKWKAKLNVTKAFISEKRQMFDNSFRMMIDIAGLRKVETSELLKKENPLQNLEGLIAFIERANDLDKQKKSKETRIEKLKREKEELFTELRKWENGVQLIECGHIERAQKKLYNEDKSLRTAKDTQQRMVSLIADLKSGFVNVAKILQFDEHVETETDQASLIDKICDKFILLEQKKNGTYVDHTTSGDRTMEKQNSNESNRSSQRPDENAMSPQNGRLRKKQPKQGKLKPSKLFSQERYGCKHWEILSVGPGYFKQPRRPSYEIG